MTLKIKKIIGLMLIGLLALINLPLSTHAQGDAFVTCDALLQDGELNLSEDIKQWEVGDKTEANFNTVFESAQQRYHGYLSCLFETAFNHVLRQEGNKTTGTLSAQITTINWMEPGQACISEQELKKSIEETAPDQLMPKALNALSDYQLFLSQLNRTLNELIPEEGGNDIQARSLKIQEKRNQINDEAQSSLIALEVSFNSLKELRFSFVFHVRLQCIINQLGAYQKRLANIRGVVDGMPNALKNASVNP